jgi:hypothetical protein
MLLRKERKERIRKETGSNFETKRRGGIPPGVFVNADAKGVSGALCVNADDKGVRGKYVGDIKHRSTK